MTFFFKKCNDNERILYLQQIIVRYILLIGVILQ